MLQEEEILERNEGKTFRVDGMMVGVVFGVNAWLVKADLEYLGHFSRIHIYRGRDG